MSFDPEFDSVDGELPADFAALGEQLQADAQRLSNVYPACQPPTKLIEALATPPRSRFRRKLPVVVSAAAMLLVACGITLLVVSREEQTAQPLAPPSPVPENSLVATPPEKPVRDMELTPVSYRPAVLDVNGPELEGLLDLWQEQLPATDSIAF